MGLQGPGPQAAVGGRVMKDRNLKRVLSKLNNRRDFLSDQLDKAYSQDDMALYIALEERYKRLAQTIERLLYRLRSNGMNISELKKL